jgi:hypothetical protein
MSSLGHCQERSYIKLPVKLEQGSTIRKFSEVLVYPSEETMTMTTLPGMVLLVGSMAIPATHAALDHEFGVSNRVHSENRQQLQLDRLP